MSDTSGADPAPGAGAAEAAAQGGATRLIASVVNNRVAAVLLMVLVLGGGVFATTGLDRQLLPNVDLKQVVVTVPYPGANLDEVDASITRRVEERLQGIEGASRITARSVAGNSTVVVNVEPLAQTAQVLNMAAAGRGAGLEPRTAETYTKLLEDLFLVRRLGAWGRTLRARTAASPKIHVLDSGVAARLLGLSPARLGRLDPAALSEFGHLLETFVVGELLKQASWNSDIATVGHWRTHDDHEVDLVIERHDGAVTAFEVKAAARITARDARGLRALRDALGDTFNAGIVLHTGDLTYRLDDRIIVAPIDLLWSSRG